ncbi:MAG: hypothetical protein HKN57_09075 [Xanthomonadales bacterium]|nr:hypothetical protein [Gammaproteobacteria bacterium]MBT8052264.1 hypothetical protein [Gammaproteobacteria bacterium]NND57392.1 hypothetical protein [Xanthomonadales bacterium]NNK52588.1 hypothetical protein [Xanthomonadales bacterium]
MTRFCRIIVAAFIVMTVMCSPSVHAVDTGLDIDYAEIQPLAVESILLDVTRIGDRLVAVGERGHVVFSDDGSTWRQAEHVPTRSTLTTVFSYGDRLWAGGHDAVIITSGDRGKTWSRENFDPERMQAVMDLYFADENNGVAIGSYGLYLVTDDGGKTWMDSVVDGENEYHLNSMAVFDDGRRIIAGEAGYSYRSFDSGETWEPLDLPYIGSMWGAIKMPNGCVVFYGLRGHAMESCNFGESWRELETGTQLSLSGAAERDGFLIMVGNSGVVLTMEDGATSQYLHSSGVDFSSVVALGNGRFLLVGEDGLHFYPETSVEETRP